MWANDILPSFLSLDSTSTLQIDMGCGQVWSQITTVLCVLKTRSIFYSKFDLCDPKFRSKAKLIDLVHIRSHWRPYQRKKNSNNWKYTKKNPNFRQIAPIFDLTPPPEYLLSSRGCPSFRPLVRMSNFSLNDSQQSRHCKIWTNSN